MAVNVADADAYIALNCIYIEDWEDADEAKKTRILNVASRTLINRFPRYVIPDEAVYEFANVLVQVWNDTNKYARHGVNQFSVSGVASFGFKNEEVGSPDDDPAEYIPQAALDIIGDENGVKLPKRSVKWTVL